jgi:hypothetical protein
MLRYLNERKETRKNSYATSTLLKFNLNSSRHRSTSNVSSVAAISETNHSHVENRRITSMRKTVQSQCTHVTHETSPAREMSLSGNCNKSIWINVVCGVSYSEWPETREALSPLLLNIASEYIIGVV